jgi:predicted butyrate kinase (DUF1464 family)
VTDPAELRDALRAIEKNINLTEESYEGAAQAITSGKAGGVYKILIEKLSAVQS